MVFLASLLDWYTKNIWQSSFNSIILALTIYIVFLFYKTCSLKNKLSEQETKLLTDLKFWNKYFDFFDDFKSFFDTTIIIVWGTSIVILIIIVAITSIKVFGTNITMTDIANFAQIFVIAGYAIKILFALIIAHFLYTTIFFIKELWHTNNELEKLVKFKKETELAQKEELKK